MTRPTVPLLIMLALATSFAACARASGEIRGGEQEIDTSPVPYIGCDATEGIDAGTGDTWTDLHRDLFSAEGRAGCANPACHGSPQGKGVHKITCFDRANCRESILAQGWVRLPGDQEFPENSGFYGVLRHCDDDRKTVGFMPQQPESYYFSKASMARVRAWIAAGAPDN
jgi:hypothetical protein